MTKARAPRKSRSLKREISDNDKPDLIKILDNFTSNTTSLGVFIRNIAPIARKHDQAHGRRITRIAKQILREYKMDPGLSSKGKHQEPKVITHEGMERISALARSLEPILPLTEAVLLYRSSFVLLMSYFDYLLSDLIRYYYRQYPEALPSKEASLTLSELKRLGSVNDAIDFVIEREILAVMYGNLEKQKQYLARSLHVDTWDNIINWDRIAEALLLRNLIVHNNCRVNQRYLDGITSLESHATMEYPKEGAQVHISESYFQHVYEEMCVAGVILLQSCWRKWNKDKIDQADGLLIQVIYRQLSDENWSCAERVSLYAIENPVSSQASRLMLNINYCQSLKWQGKKDELEQKLKQFDASALSPKFALALHALRSNTIGFWANVENAIIVDGLQEGDFMEWPLFRELREEQEYTERIKAVFKSIHEKQQIIS